jgi:hypothetical protein
MRLRHARGLAPLLALAALVAQPAGAAACSPPFEEPTIRALGPRQVVVVGTIGEKLAAGRVFHVERWFNGGSSSRIVIAFKEGEPVGDCSYLVSDGQRLIIAPDMNPDGSLSAILPTLQADPESDTGRRYVAEAIELFGPGRPPTTDDPAIETPSPTDEGVNSLLIGLVVLGVAGAVALLFGGTLWFGRARAR